MSENMKKYYNELFMNKKDNTEKIFEDVSNDFKKNINQNFEKLIQDKYALDLGYGYGNYTIFLAEKGYNVDAIDIVKPYWLKNRIKNNETLKKNINIYSSDIRNIVLKKKYSIVVAKDVLHYLKIDELQEILYKIKKNTAKRSIIYIVMFADIKRRDRDGNIKLIENEANLSEHNVVEIINKIFTKCVILTSIENYREKEKYNNKYKYYFEAKRISFVIKRGCL